VIGGICGRCVCLGARPFGMHRHDIDGFGDESSTLRFEVFDVEGVEGDLVLISI
jgi:hypothetical protein